jgi:uncharacterized protein (TIGR03084 family)
VSGPDYAALLDDLAAEEAALDRLVARLDEAGWRTPTPAAGWDIKDSIAHLANTEDLAIAALRDPDEFARRRDALFAAGDAGQLGAGRSMSGPEVRRWWLGSGAAVREALARLDARDRIGWFEGPMSAMSFATARLMESWAHGQDVRDALGQPPEASARLRHVAELGVRTRPFAYRVRGREAPSAPVRVELTGPDGEAWAWGDSGAADRVRGPALDFCLVVSQRVNPRDTDLVVEGPAAAEWVAIAQAFAGPPTDQRPAR